MGIFQELQQHPGSMAFYGFPAIPTMKGNVLTVKFPKGYEPHGSKTQEVAELMQKQFGGKIVRVTKKLIKVTIDPEIAGAVLLRSYMDDDSDK